MKDSEILTNEFFVMYDEDAKNLCIYTRNDGEVTKFPIKLALRDLKNMGPADASKWVGETLLLLIPEIRKELFGIGCLSEDD